MDKYFTPILNWAADYYKLNLIKLGMSWNSKDYPGKIQKSPRNSLDGFQKFLHPCALDESSLIIGRVFHVFMHPFVLAESATSSIRVKHGRCQKVKKTCLGGLLCNA